MPIKEVAQFKITQLQILDEEGTVDKKLLPDLKNDEIIGLYRSMVFAREADQRMLKLQRQGRIGTFPPCTGQEAATCGAVHAMGKKDWLVTSYRELGGRLMRGDTLDQVLLYYNGYEEGSKRAAQNRVLPTQVILGSQLPHAVGLAYASRLLGEEEKDTAVLAFVGDGASSQGDFHEALNFAGVWKAPVVFICQNNGWAISIPRGAQTASKTIAQKAVAYGFPGIQVDGNDVFAMVKATREAMARARAGEGPTLIEAVTYRLMMHTTADDPKKYRTEEEEQRWWKKDPLTRLRTYMEREKIWDAAREEALRAEIKEEVDAAVQRFESTGDFPPDAPFDHVLGTPDPELETQRQEFLARRAEEVNHGQA